MTDRLTYVYALVRSTRRPDVRTAPGGMPGSKGVHALPAGERLWAIVGHVPPRDYDEGAIAAGVQDLDWVGRRAMAHEAVVEHFLKADAVLPMQLFTLFTSDERALAHVAADRRRIERILTRVAGQVEWGLRLTFDEKAARQAVEQVRGRGGVTSGAAYLVRKRDLLDVTRVQLAGAKREADRLYRLLSREVTEARRRTATEQAAPGSRLLLDAAFLVPARGAGAFRTILRAQARTLEAAGLNLSLTGPWPPYNFIDSPSARGRKKADR